MTAWELFYLLWGLGMGWCLNGMVWRHTPRRKTAQKPRIKNTRSHWV